MSSFRKKLTSPGVISVAGSLVISSLIASTLPASMNRDRADLLLREAKEGRQRFDKSIRGSRMRILRIDQRLQFVDLHLDDRLILEAKKRELQYWLQLKEYNLDQLADQLREIERLRECAGTILPPDYCPLEDTIYDR